MANFQTTRVQVGSNGNQAGSRQAGLRQAGLRQAGLRQAGLQQAGLLVVLLSVISMALLGCASEQEPVTILDANNAYAAGDYAGAYEVASPMATRGSDLQRASASYVAGMSAWKLGDRTNAIQHLRRATVTGDRSLAADAKAALGLVYAESERYDDAARSLLEAARNLEGEDRANAYFHAAVSQQKLGRLASARTNLRLARAYSSDATFRERVTQQLDVTGYTLQFGAFSESTNASAAASQLVRRVSNSAAAGLGQPRLVPGTDRFGRTVTFVQLGEFTTFQSAHATRDQIGDFNAIIIPLAD